MFVIAPPDAVPLDQVRRALFIKLRHHGDVLLSGPALAALKSAAPHCEIDALVYRDTRDMLADHPALSRLHTIDRQWKKLGPLTQLGHEWRLLRELQRRRYDLVVHLTEHRRGAWLTRLIKPRWSVAPAGDYGKFFARSFSHRYPLIYDNRRHTVERHLDALRRLGIFPEAERRLAMVPGVEADAVVETLLARHGLQGRPFVVVHPGSRWMFKCWPAAQFSALIERLQNAGWPVVVTGAPDKVEAKMIEAIVAALPTPPVVLQGQLTLKQLGALIGRARLFVGVDSAPMHIAAAMQTPTLALFGPSGEIEWGPWQVEHRLLTSDHPCRPCYRDGCGGGKRSECLEAITLDRVWGAAQELLEPAK
ncbi:putative lipopolysaccharide heptosyltransferase III [Chitinimonas lacunae]|uniref:Lipopolysaccharide heptosyltransferase III n=1 Tax=Chitinimonas lacunae TaxID=1963018 RepID=A0ABV8MTS1_9NEIS